MSTLRFRSPVFTPRPRDYRGAGEPTRLPLPVAEKWRVVGHTVGWWTAAARAAVAGTLGVCVLAAPELSLTVLLALLAGYASVTGASAWLAATEVRRVGGDATPLVACAAATLVLVSALVLWPAPTPAVVVTLFAGWMALSGAWEVVLGRRLRAVVPHASRVSLVGATSVVFALGLLLTVPRGAPRVVGVLLGIYGLVSAAFLLGLALRVRRAPRPDAVADDAAYR